MPLTMAPPHAELLVVSSKTKVGLVTSNSMTVWHYTIAVFGKVEVVLRAVVIKVCMHAIMRRAAVCQRCWQ